MLRNMLLLIVLIGAVLGFNYSMTTHVPAAPAQAINAPRKPAPDFTFKDPQGRSHTLAEYKGHAVLLNFWASWCLPCRVEFPQLIALAKAEPQRIRILALTVDHDKAAMQRFINGQGALPDNLIIGMDSEKKISQDLFQTIRYPESILIDPQLNFVHKYIGTEMAWDSAGFRQELDKISR